MRLIDAENVTPHPKYTDAMNAAIVAHVLRQPTIDAEPVRHGRWIPTGVSNSTGPIVRCSACGQYINPSATAIELNRQKIEPAFCEKCGAKMDGGTCC